MHNDTTSPETATEPTAPEDHSAGSSEHVAGRLLRSLLDPQSLRVMMATGGGLLSAGLVVWLWTVGVFEDPLVAAFALGAANLAMLAMGAGVARSTRYSTAGTAITLLGCLLLPLNLWFYDAQGLITLRHGGHLWVPALACCVIYAGVAHLLRNPLFVFTFVAGIAMTGLLILADEQVGRFWEILAPSMFLVVLGALAIHAERLFPADASAFSRRRFGAAFFHAGHVVMALGLLVLLSGRLLGWIDASFLQSLPWIAAPELAVPKVVAVDQQKMVAMLIVLLASYTYGFSQVVVAQDQRRWGFATALTLLWSGVIFLDWLGVRPSESLLLLAVAGVAMVSRLAEVFLLRHPRSERPLSVLLGSTAAACTTLATGWGIAGVARHLHASPDDLLRFPLDLTLLAAMVLAAASWGLATWQFMRQEGRQGLSLTMVAMACALATAAAIAVGLVTDEPIRMMLGMLSVPLLLHAVSAVRGGDWQQATLRAAYATTLLTVVLSVGQLLGIQGSGLEPHVRPWLLSALFAIAAISFTLTAIRSQRPLAILFEAACGSVALWQLLVALDWREHAPLIAANAAGCATVLIARFSRPSAASRERFHAVGSSLTILGSTGGLLLTLSRVMTDEAAWALLPLAVVQCFSMVVLVAVGSSSERQVGRLYAAAHVIAGVLVINALAGLSFWERVEIVTVAIGMVILASGHHRWLHEEDHKPDPLVDYDLLLGSLLSAFPLMIGLLFQRLGDYAPVSAMQFLHATGGLMVSLGLLAAGVTCKIRATTLVGGLSLSVWLLSLVGLLRLPELENAAIQMMVGGGLLFTAAVGLSVYRDRLLALPGRVRQREGVFRVLEWR
jgi:hypothetical protein